jgi:hypothetical protein
MSEPTDIEMRAAIAEFEAEVEADLGWVIDSYSAGLLTRHDLLTYLAGYVRGAVAAALDRYGRKS